MTSAWRLVALLLVSALALQVYFLTRVGLMAVVDPTSSTFERSEAWRLAGGRRALGWQQRWVPYDRIAPALKRAVIAAEDAGFNEHGGVEWDALEKAWERNQKAEARVERINAQLDRRLQTTTGGRTASPARPVAKVEPKIFGGSTITQQLAKNLFFEGERSWPRKAQEFVVTLMLEGLLNKRRILEIYLNDVEWGEGVFGAEAAAAHYFHVEAATLTPAQAARLAVMLPAPKRFEKRPGSAYMLGRAGTVAARMARVELP